MIVYFCNIVLIRRDETTKQHYGCVIMQSGQAMMNTMLMQGGGGAFVSAGTLYLVLFVFLLQEFLFAGFWFRLQPHI